jgi:probable F420-dependent oxidoreductase
MPVNGVRVGLMFPPHQDLARLLPTARAAEQQGFDFLACGEHVFFNGASSNAFVTLAAAAGVTEHVRLLTALAILPLYPAPLAAKMAATLDRISGGRLDVGVGVGGEYPPEFAACGVPLSERGPRTDEALEVLTALFTGDRITYRGRFVAVEDQRLDPPPLQQPRPPLWVGGRKDAALRRAGRFGDVWLPYMCTPEQLDRGLDRVRAVATDYGRAAVAVAGAAFVWASVGNDPNRARQMALSTLGDVYSQDFTALADRYVPIGTPEQVAARLQDYVDAGAESIVFAPACGQEELDSMIGVFADQVLPALRVQRASP